ncbi:MBL fold metallo-hydrolase [Afifella sp. IM 167]|uniref:MBL fold metallo-hydrolase n=1 Tax=Afifella sp. IM 167 TaxID=2033586 RepID=UPI001CCEAD9E|nr:MBL fold metallo-hydrolase [Afifella sp. IM 167]
MRARLVLLGTKGGPAVRPASPLPTASALVAGDELTVVDCGAGVTVSLANAGLPLTMLERVFVTHLHSDHVLELGPLLHTAWTSGLSHPLKVFGPPGMREYLEHFLAAMRFDIETRIADEGRPPLGELLRLTEYGEGEVMADAGLRVTALRNIHPPVEESYALRFDFGGGPSVVFSGDTARHPPLAAFARGADILVHEAMLPAGMEKIVEKVGGGDRLRAHLKASHSTAGEAGWIAREAGVGRLVLHHLIPADDPDFSEADWLAATAESWEGPVTVGRDGLVVPIDKKREGAGA